MSEQRNLSRRRGQRISAAVIEAIEDRLMLSTVPSGFTDTEITTGLTSPTALDIAPDGRVFIAQQDGTIRVVKADKMLATPFANLSSEVDSSNERGMLGLTLDPNFNTNHFVYVYYTANGPTTHNRISRLVANGDTMQAGSEVAIADFPDIGSAIWHMGGPIHFGPDGKLYVGVGDHQQSAQSQSLSSVFGKILRLNPDGTIPTDNPFYNQTTGINRSIYALGFRNPFTFDFQPGTGLLYANDVGDTSFEEIDNVTAGANYGWPSTEGDFNQATYPNFTRPLYAYSHSLGYCIAGASFYNPVNAKFPSQYVGKFFFVDFSFGWMKTVDPVTKVVSNFATGLSFPTDAEVADDGTMYFLQRGMNTGTPTAGSGSLHKLDYPSANSPPSIVQAPQDQSGGIGQQVTFSVSVAGTPPFTYQWRRNGTDINGATSPTYTRTIIAGDDNSVYTVAVKNSVTTTVSTGGTLHVLTGNAPVPTILTPTVSTMWNAGQTISFSGSATDSEDGTLPASAFTWEVDYYTDNVARPLLLPTSGITSGSFNVPNSSPFTGTAAFFRILMTVKDSTGFVVTTQRDIQPNTATATFATNVPGLSVNLDGAAHTTPYSVAGIVGLLRTIDAPATQVLNGTTYQFVSWSDGGARTHQIAWPPSNQTYTANYVVVPITYVSDLPYAQNPTNGWGSPEKDKSNGEQGAADGKTITLNGTTYSKGLGVHANSDVRYNIAGKGYTNFFADVGVDDEVGTGGSVVFQVYLDATKVYDSGTLTGSSATASVNVAIPSNASTLRLVVTDGGNGNVSDHADWANARLTSGASWAGLAAPISYPTGTNAHGLTTADVNKDGFLDLIVANAGASTISVLLGDGTGNFGTPTNYATGSTPKSVVAKDLNGDGWVDLVTPNQDAGTVSVFLNKKDGTFNTAVDYAATTGAHEVALGDVDGDNDIDIVEAGWGQSVVRVLFNNGSGVFSGGTNYNIGNAPHSVQLADFNGDTKLDIAVADHDSNNVAILLNSGTGGVFNAASFYNVGSLPHSIRAADLNGDSKIDLVTANEGSNNISILFGTGTGSFANAVNYATGLVPKGVAIGDVNNDSLPDILTADTAGNYPNSNNPGGDQISVLLNGGSGVFGTFTNFTTGRTPFAITLADFDGDGDLDVASANWHTNDVTILKNQLFVSAANTPPTAVADSTSTTTNTPVAINILGNDIDNGSVDPTTVVISTAPGSGAVSVNPTTGVVTYTPNNGFNGTDTFQYTVKDNLGLTSSPATVTIGVSAPVTSVYVSDLTPTFTQNGWGSYEKDKSNGETGANDGKTITLNGTTFAKGLGVHAASDLRYNLVGGNYSEFRATIGVDDEVGTGGSVVFQVYVDSTLKYTSPTLTGSSASVPIVVSVAGGSTLRLVVTDSGNGNASDHADWANAILTKNTGVMPPDAPTGLQAVYGSNQIGLQWVDASTTETGFRVERKTTQDGNYSAIADLPAGSTTYSDTDILPGTTYYYHVYAINSGGPSIASNEAFATVPNGTGSMVYLSDLTPTSSTNGWGSFEKDASNGEQATGDGHTLTLNSVGYDKGLGVHANSDIRYNIAGQGYNEFRANIGVDDEVGNAGSVVFQVYLDGTKVYDSGTLTGSSGTVAVVVPIAANISQLRLVVTDSGNGNVSDHADWALARLVVSTPTNPPAQPTNLAAAFNNTSGKIDLTWTDGSTDETGYRVERKTGAGGTYATIATLPAGSTGYSDASTFVSGTQYYYRVFATNAGGDSQPALEAFATTPTGSVTTYLSDLTPTGTPINGWGPYQKDTSNGESGAADGKVITLNGVTYTKGLGVHATSDITYNLAGGSYKSFLSDVGLDDEVGSGGSVIFQVYLDGVQVYDSGTMTGASATQQVNISLVGKSTLRLVVNASTNGNTNDHADWAGARLLA